MDSIYYQFDLDTHKRRRARGLAAHERLFEAARDAFEARGWMRIRTVNSKIVRWYFENDVMCSVISNGLGLGTRRWMATSPAGKLWLMLNMPEEAYNIEEGSHAGSTR